MEAGCVPRYLPFLACIESDVLHGFKTWPLPLESGRCSRAAQRHSFLVARCLRSVVIAAVVCGGLLRSRVESGLVAQKRQHQLVLIFVDGSETCDLCVYIISWHGNQKVKVSTCPPPPVVLEVVAWEGIARSLGVLLNVLHHGRRSFLVAAAVTCHGTSVNRSGVAEVVTDYLLRSVWWVA